MDRNGMERRSRSGDKDIDSLVANDDYVKSTMNKLQDSLQTC